MRQRLLVVDDQRLDRAIAGHAAKRLGFHVTNAGSIGETREHLEKGHRFDFVVLDLSLGAEDGLDVLPLIARFNPSAVLVLASGFGDRILGSSQRLASSLGLLVAGILRKPISPAALQQLLRAPPHKQVAGGVAGLPIPAEHIQHAIVSGQIKPWFQTKISLATGATVGAEALARWVRTDGSSVPPNTFIPIAEKSFIGVPSV